MQKEDFGLPFFLSYFLADIYRLACHVLVTRRQNSANLYAISVRYSALARINSPIADEINNPAKLAP
ncbi:MAG: hypothetical protein ACRC4K_09410 [Plesiomonas shigelloides]